MPVRPTKASSSHTAVHTAVTDVLIRTVRRRRIGADGRIPYTVRCEALLGPWLSARICSCLATAPALPFPYRFYFTAPQSFTISLAIEEVSIPVTLYT